ncbi:hypothetical protein Ahy_A03g014353 [Arachis hypogaea]|uniref:Uncharacterized protein n=1 Tax=Arachis hypogaea TaxID=3818 RepID=A0A445DXJ9_ARAHY|nr:hypothetical protein Ahy_A03g014353 [Arachis hypogaea]
MKPFTLFSFSLLSLVLSVVAGLGQAQQLTPSSSPAPAPSSDAMDAKCWRNSSSRRSIQLGRSSYSEIEDIRSLSGTRSSKLRWKILWMKLKKEKKKLFECASATTPFQVPYDSYTYSQNFDQGTAALDEPDILSRSFSVRFADPSRLVLVKKGLVSAQL